MEKITTSIGIFTKGAWYLGGHSTVFKVTSNPSKGRLAGFSLDGSPLSFSFLAGEVKELPSELDGGKIEGLPWEGPKCDGVSVYQVSDTEDFGSDEILTRISSIDTRGRYVDIEGCNWRYCRPVPDELQHWGD